VSEPQDAFVSKVRGRYRKQIIIKFKGEISGKLRKTLENLGAGWVIDVDPISIA
jgi:primosomal protein N'